MTAGTGTAVEWAPAMGTEIETETVVETVIAEVGHPKVLVAATTEETTGTIWNDISHQAVLAGQPIDSVACPITKTVMMATQVRVLELQDSLCIPQRRDFPISQKRWRSPSTVMS